MVALVVQMEEAVEEAEAENAMVEEGLVVSALAPEEPAVSAAVVEAEEGVGRVGVKEGLLKLQLLAGLVLSGYDAVDAVSGLDIDSLLGNQCLLVVGHADLQDSGCLELHVDRVDLARADALVCLAIAALSGFLEVSVLPHAHFVQQHVCKARCREAHTARQLWVWVGARAARVGRETMLQPQRLAGYLE